MHNRAKIMPARPSYAHPSVVTPVTNEPVRQTASEELGPEVAAAIPKTEQQPPGPVEEGAAALVQSITNGLRDRAMDDQGVTRITIQLRNQSRSSVAEFNAMRERLAQALNRAADDARGARLHFAVESENQHDGPSDAHYLMQGTAYLISAGGFDLWELFLSISPASQHITIWDAPRPVRLLRTPRAGQPLIVTW